MAQMMKNPPAMQETWVRSLGQEDSLGGGHGNPLQYSFLGEPMDRGAWWATVQGFERVRHNLVTKPPPLRGGSESLFFKLTYFNWRIITML